MAENGNENVIGYGEEMPWLLPANAFDPQESCLQEKWQLRYQKHHQSKRHYSKSPAAEPLHNSYWKSSQLRDQRTRNGTSKWAIGGPGMQAVFLDSGRRSCGTGVFLPPRAGAHSPSSNRPERTSKQSNAGGVDCDGLLMSGKKKESINASAGVGSGAAQCCSPEIFLPKEWTY